ncbi:hypothetical protein [Iamia sp.]|uniref:hypothetical protein n=1 Tax=Iamia sp. TaxID=2722710 RepID=UPI002CDDB564|nr:hypothetical protein [Iamia sp.]HXH58992.1 hypothetical protein [Iamia sp.]
MGKGFDPHPEQGPYAAEPGNPARGASTSPIIQGRLFAGIASATPTGRIRTARYVPRRVTPRWQQEPGNPSVALGELGTLLVDDLLAGQPPSRCELLSLHDVLWEAVTINGFSPEGALGLVVSVLNDRAARGDLAPSTVAKATALQARFTRYLAVGHHIANLAELQQRHVLGFLTAPTLTADGHRMSPSPRTRDNRRWAVALYFATLRDLGLGVGDPTAEITVRRGSPVTARPLTDEEEALGRKHAARFAGDTRGPAAWALTRAGATTGEAGAVTPRSIDWAGNTVRLAGGARAERRVPLEVWDTTQLRVRLQGLDIGPSDELPLLYEGTRGGDSRTSTASQIIARILRRSGLGAQPGVKPSSITAWAGRRAYEQGDLFAARRLLGLRGLDDTARTIGLKPEVTG